MRALTIQQPWASLVASGRKSVELRSWSTSHRGPIAVCAGARAWSDEAVARFGDGPRGVVLCTVDLVDVRPATRADLAAACATGFVRSHRGLYAWVLRDPRAADGRRVRGQVGLFELAL